MVDAEREASSLLAGINMMVMDRASSSARIILTDGRVVASPLDSSFFGTTSTIIRTTYAPRSNQLSMVTDRGDPIEVELPTLQESVPRDNRPVVYLDQRDWSLLARALFEPQRLRSQSEQDAATYLITLARARKIILPMSFAHLGETSKWNDAEGRYHLALTVTQLSWGWQMRYPLDVWEYELQERLASRFRHVALPPLDVFTLEGCATQDKRTLKDLSPSWSELPDGIKYVSRAIICMSSYIDTILASESTPMTPIPEWVDAFQLITDELAKMASTPFQKRRVLRAMLLKDIQSQVIEAASRTGITANELENWIELYVDEDFHTMMCLGFWRLIYQDRHLDATYKWRSNDLTDMMYLTCAAGYADYILAERSLTSHLNQAAKRLDRQVKVYSRIGELVAALKGAGF